MGLRTVVVRLGAGFVLLVSVACGAMIADEPSDPVPLEGDGAATDSSSQEAPSAVDGGRVTRPAATCSLAPGPSCVLEECVRRTLHVSESPGAPHGIVSDASFVYWLEQPATNDGYNGHAPARVLRVDKVGATDESRTTPLASDQMAATAIALDGEWLYWTVYDKGTERIAKLRRVRADCGGGCVPEEVAVLPPGIRIMKLVRGAPGVLFGAGEAGDVFRFTVKGDLAKTTGPLITKKGVGSVVVTDEYVYAAGLQDSTIARMDPEGASVVPAFIKLPRVDAGDQGVSHVWTDCREAWATRGPTSVLRLALGDGGAETLRNDIALSVYGLAGDATYLYIAGANEGLAAFDLTTNVLTLLHGGKVFNVAADAEGVYWGEHDIDKQAAGTIYMIVK